MSRHDAIRLALFAITFAIACVVLAVAESNRKPKQ